MNIFTLPVPFGFVEDLNTIQILGLMDCFFYGYNFKGYRMHQRYQNVFMMSLKKTNFSKNNSKTWKARMC